MERGGGKQRGGRGNWRGKPHWFAKKPQPIHPSILDGTASRNADDSCFIISTQESTNPYRGWKHYFLDEKFKSDSDIASNIAAAVAYFEKRIANGSPSLREVEEARRLTLDWEALSDSRELVGGWPNFKRDLEDTPASALACLNLALYEVARQASQPNTDDSGADPEFPVVHARIVNYQPVVSLKNLKAGLYGKLVSVRGTVIRVGSARLSCSWLSFACNACGHVSAVGQRDGAYRAPTSCRTISCSSRTFTPLCSARSTKTRTRQTIRIQENLGDDQREGGRVPRTLECDVTDDLVDSCAPGDNVTVTGIVKVNNGDDGGKKGRSNNLFMMYLEGVSIVNSKGHGTNARNQNPIGVEFSLKDYYAIQEIHNEPNPFRLLVNSLCPTVYGHEMVKAGLLLALAGGAGAGSAGAGAGSAGHSTRGDPHVLVVGDPGLGKSHMLHACASAAPRGVYVCGNTASASGLTVTLTKEAGGGGDYALEAGALVLANHGACCIDEFDKMSTQHQALLEAMEQQSVSVAKGGVVCSLPTRTAVLAAANPAGGHYNRAKSVSENLRMSQPLLSRFDLVFVLLDRPDEELDSLLSEHVMALHAGRGKGRAANRTGVAARTSFSTTSDLSAEAAESLPLSRRLKMARDEAVELVPQALLRKYLAYARKYVPWPVLSREAAAVVQEFYLTLRRERQPGVSAPVTTRQLESIIRLTQARAKIELREEASADDAKDVIELVKWSMRDTYTTDTGAMDFNRSINGSGMSKGSKVKRFVGALQRKGQLEGRTSFTTAELREVHSTVGLKPIDFHDFLAALNTQGFLLKTASNTYRLLAD